jgi:hypothetical protein
MAGTMTDREKFQRDLFLKKYRELTSVVMLHRMRSAMSVACVRDEVKARDCLRFVAQKWRIIW